MPKARVATKSSKNWQSLPGNWDTTNLFKVFPSTNKYGIPTIPPTQYVPKQLIQWNMIKSEKERGIKEDSAVMYYLDDYRIESCWNNPPRSYELLKDFRATLSPDYSLYRGTPQVVQAWNVYRNSWLGCYWTLRGLTVVPSVSWSDEKSFEFCFLGAPTQSVVCISPVGVYDNDGKRHFIKGFMKMCEVLNPTLVLSYGGLERIGLPSDIPPTYIYQSRWERIKQNKVE